jgi:polyhydroxyalkanoate synthase
VPDEDAPWITDQPGVAFDAALISSAFGVARRPLPIRDAIALGKRLARHPERAALPLVGLARDARSIVAGRSQLDPSTTDRRYADPAWRTNKLFRALSQGHLSAANRLEEILDEAELDPASDFRLRIALLNVAAALAPANFPLLNPAALKAMIDTGGASIVIGAKRFAKDVSAPPRLPARADPADFELGVGVAATPGAVVLRTPVMELLQYSATTPTVQHEPLLIVPSVVNKYYLTDLSPGRSLTEFAIAGGYETFTISWINPDRSHRHFDLDTYIKGILDALEAIELITGSGRTHTLGVCAGGQLLTIALAYLAAGDEDNRVASVSLPVCVMDHSDPASPTGVLSPRAVRLATAAVKRRGLVEGHTLQGALAWLRPVDSIWWAWVHRYLLAGDMPKLDLFHWAEDITNLPAGLVVNLLELTVENALTKPGRLVVLGRSLSLHDVTTDAYLVAGLTDHLTHWQSCYGTASMLGSKCRFVLVRGGHLQAILRPPGGRDAGFLTASSGTPRDPAAWLERATEHEGSWWEHWRRWLDRRSGGTRAAPRELGDARHPALEPAPGTYVRKRAAPL